MPDELIPPTTTPEAGGDAGNGTSQQAVPYARFAEVNGELKKLREEFTKIEEARKKAETQKLTDQAQWKELAEQKDKELQAERLGNLRLQIALKKGLPVELAGRLQGTTADELEADAVALAKLVKVSAPGVPPAPTRQEGQPMFTAAQMSDSKWVREHEKEILQAYSEGKIR